MSNIQLAIQAKIHQERVKQFQAARDRFLKSTAIYRQLQVSVYGTNKPDWHVDNSTAR